MCVYVSVRVCVCVCECVCECVCVRACKDLSGTTEVSYCNTLVIRRYLGVRAAVCTHLKFLLCNKFMVRHVLILTY